MPIPISEPTSIDAWQQQRADILNEQPGGLDGIDCPICKNRGINYEVRNGEVIAAECECMVKRRSVWSMRYSGLGDLLIYDFDNFDTHTDWQARMKRMAQEYAENDSGGWLLCAGQNGAGKTHLCTAVCKRLMERGYKVKYELWSEIFRKLRASKFDAENYGKYFDELKKSEILYIDDFLKTRRGQGVGQLSDEEIKAAYDVINARSLARDKRKRTIISTEFLFDELQKLDYATAGRIQQKCAAMIQLNRDTERDMRSKK